MSTPYCYEYPRPMVTVDLVVFGLGPEGLRALFIKRKKDPFAGLWAIPGGYLEIDEAIEAAARRELKEETGLQDLLVLEEIGVFGDPGRDPRGRTISVAHAGIVRAPLPRVKGGDDAEDAAWLDPRTAGASGVRPRQDPGEGDGVAPHRNARRGRVVDGWRRPVGPLPTGLTK